MAVIPPPVAEEVFIKEYDPRLTQRLLGYIRPTAGTFT
jgi:hypothetical protein